MVEQVGDVSRYLVAGTGVPWLRNAIYLVVIGLLVGCVAGGLLVGRPGAVQAFDAISTDSKTTAAPPTIRDVLARSWDASSERPAPVIPLAIPRPVRLSTRPKSTSVSVPHGPAAPPNSPVSTGYGCQSARVWLAEHAAPGFLVMCPGNAFGHQAMTCMDVPGYCPGQRIIAIADPCPAAYKNEAYNSWIIAGLKLGRLDPYGYCTRP